MEFIEYWNNLDDDEQAEFAEAVGASVMTIKQKYMCPARSREVPRRERLQKIIQQSRPMVSRSAIFDHFYDAGKQDSVA